MICCIHGALECALASCFEWSMSCLSGNQISTVYH
jgi:hypothetical protein